MDSITTDPGKMEDPRVNFTFLCNTVVLAQFKKFQEISCLAGCLQTLFGYSDLQAGRAPNIPRLGFSWGLIPPTLPLDVTSTMYTDT